MYLEFSVCMVGLGIQGLKLNLLSRARHLRFIVRCRIEIGVSDYVHYIGFSKDVHTLRSVLLWL